MKQEGRRLLDEGLRACVPVDEAVDSVFEDSIHLLFHLLLLCQFDLGHLRGRVHTNPRTEDLKSNRNQVVRRGPNLQANG